MKSGGNMAKVVEKTGGVFEENGFSVEETYFSFEENYFPFGKIKYFNNLAG